MSLPETNKMRHCDPNRMHLIFIIFYSHFFHDMYNIFWTDRSFKFWFKVWTWKVIFIQCHRSGNGHCWWYSWFQCPRCFPLFIMLLLSLRWHHNDILRYFLYIFVYFYFVHTLFECILNDYCMRIFCCTHKDKWAELRVDLDDDLIVSRPVWVGRPLRAKPRPRPLAWSPRMASESKSSRARTPALLGGVRSVGRNIRNNIVQQKTSKC